MKIPQSKMKIPQSKTDLRGRDLTSGAVVGRVSDVRVVADLQRIVRGDLGLTERHVAVVDHLITGSCLLDPSSAPACITAQVHQARRHVLHCGRRSHLITELRLLFVGCFYTHVIILSRNSNAIFRHYSIEIHHSSTHAPAISSSPRRMNLHKE